MNGSVCAFVLAAGGCMPDLGELTNGIEPITCDWIADPEAAGTVPEGVCWRVAAVTDRARVRLAEESCDAARRCLTAVAGETVMPLARPWDLGPDAEVYAEEWPCDELASACEVLQ